MRRKLALTVQLARIMLPTLTFIALAAAVMGMLNSLHHFFIPALSPAMFNVVTILVAWFVLPFMPGLGIEPIMAIAIGTLLGGVAQLAMQWPALRSEGFRYRPLFDWSDEGLRRVLVLMGPGTIGLAATQVNLLVNMQLATSQEIEAVNWLTYAFRLMYLPIGLFGVSIATAALPAVSRQHHQEDTTAVRNTVVGRSVADADAERAGDGRPDRARRADRARDLRAWPLHSRRTPWPRRPRCSSTRSAWSATRSCASRRRCSMRSDATGSR